MVTDLGKLMPGFDFLQGLMKNAGAAMPGLPGMSQWIAPTLDPAELEKRIQELRTVQFWLEQNARLLATTIQALEVQRMTLATLQTMNLPMTQLRDALKVQPSPPPAAAREDDSEDEDEDADGDHEDEEERRATAPRQAPSAPAGAAAAPAAASPAIDPLQWWGALTQQFTELAARAVQDNAEAARSRGAPTAEPSPADRNDTPAAAPAPVPAAAAARRKRTR